MKFIDLHCDTAMKIFDKNLELKNNTCSIDIEKLKKGNSLGQVFAFFVELTEVDDPYTYFNEMYDYFINQIKINNDSIAIVKDIRELRQAEKNNKIGAFLSIEEGQVIGNKLERLQKVYNKGIRIITLTWNFENDLGYPNAGFKYRDRGLKKNGIEAVKICEELGILPDASHLSDGGFYDLIKYCRKPFIVTHSNSRSITNHPRNLTDDMIKLLGNKGGVMGINFCSEFLGENSISTVEEMICHIKHIRNVGGIDVISLGSDFDGIENEVEIKNASEFDKLYYGLKKENFSDEDIEKIFNKNVLRLFEETL